MGKPRVALTFDDGPSQWTEPILDTLRKHDARATFFVLGCHLPGNFETIKRAAAEGHELALHGFHHTPVDDLTSAELRGEIALVAQAVEHLTERPARFWRSPWGRTEDLAAEVILGAGLRIVGPGIDALDCDRDATDICRIVTPQLEDGAIVCLHDGVAPNGNEKTKSRAQTVKALPHILKACTSVTLTELLG